MNRVQRGLGNLFRFCHSCYFDRVCKAEEKMLTMYYGQCSNFKEVKK